MNGVAGFMCRYVLNGHYGCSPGQAVVERTSGPGYPTTYLVLYTLWCWHLLFFIVN